MSMSVPSSAREWIILRRTGSSAETGERMTEKKETDKKIRLAAIDLDGTLLTGAKTISGTNAGAIRAAMDAGA